MPPWLGTPAQRYRVLLIAILAFVLYSVLRVAHEALVPFFLGFVLAYLLVPMVDFIDRRSPRLLKKWRVSRKLAIILVYIMVFGAIAGVMAYFIPALTAQAAELGRMFPNYARQADRLLTAGMRDLLDRIPAEVSQAVETTMQDAMATLADTLRRGIEGTLRTLWQTLGFIIGILIVPIWLFYVLNDTDSFRRSARRMIPDRMEADARNVLTIVDGLLSAYVRGQLLVCLLVGLLALILLLALRIPMALLLATLVGLFNIVPFLGPWVGAVPGVLIALTRSPLTALWVALGFFGIQLIDGNLLAPRISGRAVHFHPSVVMILVVVGSEVAGLLGMLLAVPVSAVFRDLFRYLYLRTTEQGATPEMAMETLNSRHL